MALTWWQQELASVEAALGFKLAPPPLAWVPTYEQAFTSLTMPDGSTLSVPIAHNYLADAATAEHLRGIYDSAGTVVSVPFLDAGGPTSVNPPLRYIQWPNGVQIVAGMLAVIFSDQYPLDPKQADIVCKKLIVSRGAAPIPPEWASL
jgi:hypothetical protein